MGLMKIYQLSLVCLICLGLSGCDNRPEQKEKTAEDITNTENAFSASTQANRMGNVDVDQNMLISKGIIRPANEVEIYSRIQGQLNEVKLVEGQRVKKGEILFTYDDQDLRANVSLSESALEQANLKYEELLIGQGYKREEFDKASKTVKDYIRIKSGLNQRTIELDINKNLLKRAVVASPVSGVISNVMPKSFAYVKPGDILCTVVDTHNLIVVFSILETEIRNFTIGSTVKVNAVAYGEISYTATIRSIGSVVDQSGMIRIEATLPSSEKLMPGMTAVINL